MDKNLGRSNRRDPLVSGVHQLSGIVLVSQRRRDHLDVAAKQWLCLRYERQRHEETRSTRHNLQRLAAMEASGIFADCEQLKKGSGHARRRRPLFSDHKTGTGSIEIGKQLRGVWSPPLGDDLSQNGAKFRRTGGRKLEYAGIWLGVELQHWQASSSWDGADRTGGGDCLH